MPGTNNRAFDIYKGVETNITVNSRGKIGRPEKNIMRSQLEEILAIHRNLDKKIDSYREASSNGEYRRFWKDLQEENTEKVKSISRFMVLKCNR